MLYYADATPPLLLMPMPLRHAADAAFSPLMSCHVIDAIAIFAFFRLLPYAFAFFDFRLLPPYYASRYFFMFRQH